MFWLRIKILAELALVTKRHLSKLTLAEHKRLAVLVKQSRGRPDKNLSAGERSELLDLVRKFEPKQFGKSAAGAVRSPIRNPLRRP